MDRVQLVKAADQPNTPAGVSVRLLATDLHLSTEAVALAGILILAVGLRFAFLGRNSFWFDEAVVASVAQAKWQDIFPILRLRDTHPPFFYLMMKGWVGLAGTGEAALRFPSACFSVISVALTYALMRQVSTGWVSLISALLVSTAPFEIWSGQMARMYALLGALAIGATLLLVLGVQRQRWGYWVAYAAAATLMVYTHNLAFFMLVAHGLWVASYERPHLRRWLATAAVVAVLYTLWAPSFWFQATHLQWFLAPFYGDKPPYLKLGDLLGLFAFGGSLFGMPSYFFSNTSLTPLEQLLVLLPFLVILGSGTASLSREGRWLALLGLPLAVTVGVMQLLALGTPAFVARWFSFLGPFYAMLVALGVFALARNFRTHPDRTAAFIVAGLLLFNLAGLERYYFDPALHPYQWRSAVATVAREIKPSDLLLFGDQGNEVAFAYYFKGRAWTMKLTPQPDFEVIRGLGTRYKRIWLIVAPPADYPPLINQTVSALRISFVLADSRAINGVYPWVYRFDAKPSSSR